MPANLSDNPSLGGTPVGPAAAGSARGGVPGRRAEEPVAVDADSASRPREYVVDLSAIDLGARRRSKADIERYLPHRGTMSLLDALIWENAAHTEGVGLKRVRDDEFWVAGHFPEKAMMPGVLMIEAGAQLACYLYNVRQPAPRVVAFTRIDNAVFRSMVQPGDELLILCKEVKFGRRRFVSDIQGVVHDKVCFDAQISGMTLE